MGASHSREGELSENEDGELDFKLRSLSLDDENEEEFVHNAKLYHYVTGNKGRWVAAEKLVGWDFVKEEENDDEGDEDGYVTDEEAEEDDDEDCKKKTGFQSWVLKVGSRINALVSHRLQMRFTEAQLRVDFVYQGVWAIKFPDLKEYKEFCVNFKSCLFENTYMLKDTDANRVKVFGKDFAGWARPQEADDSIWEDAVEDFSRSKNQMANDVKETYAENVQGGIQSITLGGLDNSFLVSNSGVETFKNTPTGLHKKSAAVQFSSEDQDNSTITPKKGMLIKGETQMMVMSPASSKKKSRSFSSTVRQLDLESGKTVAEWRFEKDGTPITMTDVTNESKGAQLDSSVSTFLGLDENRLCRWDIRNKHGIVQDSSSSPVLHWSEGHQFARGTNFQCFAATGDGCIAVGSKDGKVRLYGTSSMRQAKTAFPGLGSPITSIDVTYDGKWILATTDTYLILISTVFKDKDGKIKTGFSGRMGNRIAAPRLLKLTPLDAHLAGHNQKFHGGQFSWVTESGKQENHLVVTVGNFTVIWDFKRVKQSNHECYANSTEGLKSCYCYTVVPTDESIVERNQESFFLMEESIMPLLRRRSATNGISLTELTKIHLFDWLTVILLGCAFYALHLVSPFYRFVGKYNMDNLRFPMKKDTFPMPSIPIIAVGIPLIVIVAFYLYRRDVRDFHHAVLGLCFAIVLSGVITGGIKDAVGRPRPDFFWRCFPDGKEAYTESTGEAICSGDEWVIREGHRSFPSGHTSWCFAGLGYFSLYICGKMQVFERRGHLWRIFAGMIPLLFSGYVAISRVDDYRHHWEDVVIAAIIGMSVAIVSYRQHFSSQDVNCEECYTQMMMLQDCSLAPDSSP